jgi:sugar lactone lactonase YvrE
MLAPSPRLLAALLIAALAALVLPLTANAAETYTYRAETCGTSRGHIGNDVNGVSYGGCGKSIVRFDKNAKRLADIKLDNMTFGSVAPSPDGAYIYASVNFRLIRLNKQKDGSYKKDAKWALKNYSLNNVSYKPVARNVVTDEFGNIYLSNNGTDPDTKKIAPTRILKYAPDGSVMTHFGRHGDEPADPYAFFHSRGIAVSRDGRQLFVTSHLQGQVRRFDIQADGTYAYAMTFGKLDTNCASTGGLAAPSDVAVDPWGFVYIPDTSCHKIKKFTAAGKYVATIGTGTKVLHELGVNRRGDVFAGEWNRLYLRAATNPVPGPIPAITKPVIDTTAPKLTKIALPTTTTTRAVKITVIATDAVGVAQARVANEDGTWGAWKAYATPLAHQLTAGLGYKGVYVQVRDAAGNESTVVSTTTQVVAAAQDPQDPDPVKPDAVAPSLTKVTLPATTTTRDVKLAITATDAVGITQARVANEDGVWGAWKAYATPLAHQLTAGLSYKGVYVQVRDAAGNESAVAWTTTQLVAGETATPNPPAGGAPDTTAPTLRAFTVPATTAARTVTVTIDAIDDVKVTQVRFANEDGTWGTWKAYAPAMQHQLSAGYSIKGVYVQVRDAAGNESGLLFRTLLYSAG